jgi:hypothetical protein
MKHDGIHYDNAAPVAKKSCTLIERLPMIAYVMEAPGEQDDVERAVSQRSPLIYVPMNIVCVSPQASAELQGLGVGVEVCETDIRSPPHELVQ